MKFKRKAQDVMVPGIKPQEHEHHDELQAQDPGGLNTSVSDPNRYQLQLLATVIYAKLAAQATIKEVGPGELSITQGDNSWKIKVSDDGRARISGFPDNPNVDQHIGSIDGDDLEPSLIKVGSNASELIADSLAKASEPDPPIYLPSADEAQLPGYPAEETTPEGDEHSEPEPPLDEAPPEDMGGDMGQDPMGSPPPGGDMGAPPADPGMGAPPPGAPPAGGVPPAAPPADGGAPFGMGQGPVSSRYTRVLDRVSALIQKSHPRLAARIDRISNTLEVQASPAAPVEEPITRPSPVRRPAPIKRPEPDLDPFNPPMPHQAPEPKLRHKKHPFREK